MISKFIINHTIISTIQEKLNSYLGRKRKIQNDGDVASEIKYTQQILKEINQHYYLLSNKGDPKEVSTLHKIEQAITKNQLTTSLEPICKIPQRKLVYMECFSKIIDDDDHIISPDNYLATAKASKLIHIIDHTVLLKTMQTLRQQKNMTLFCNFSFSSLRNDNLVACVNEFFSNHPQTKGKLIMEIDHYYIKQYDHTLFKVTKELSKSGWCFSLDYWNHSIETNYKELSLNGFRYLRVEIDQIMRLNDDKIKQLITNCKQNNLQIIVNKIDTEDDIKHILDFDFEYAQGNLFKNIS